MTTCGSGKRRIALVLVSDREDLYLPACVEALNRYLEYPVAQTVLLADPGHQYTASGAVNAAWSQIDNDVDFVFHMEEDFVLTAPVDIDAMCDVLDAEPRLAHLVLKRQPWNSDEIAAGGIIEQWPHDVTDRTTLGHRWVEHTKFFSLNPCLVPRRVFAGGFPEGSEPAMTDLLMGRGFYFGYWGGREEPPKVAHIGAVRSAGSIR